MTDDHKQLDPETVSLLHGITGDGLGGSTESAGMATTAAHLQGPPTPGPPRMDALGQIMKEHTMSDIAEQGEVTITVENASPILIGASAVEAIRGDANRQVDEHLRAAVGMWDDLDVSDFEQVKAMRYEIARVSECLSALFALAPLPDEDQEGE